jgi:hypothetical protein
MAARVRDCGSSAEDGTWGFGGKNKGMQSTSANIAKNQSCRSKNSRLQVPRPFAAFGSCEWERSHAAVAGIHLLPPHTIIP